ncbi:MAG: SprT-like domain-containing protein [Akkermansiaceae bacterium]|nr:SprT-like domain-containing protein [Akkermansiaceae bacterium]
MKKRIPEQVIPVLLPQAEKWADLAAVEAYALSCMSVCGLADWRFEWDRAVRRLGCCKMTKRVLSLSRYYVEAYLQRDADAIRRTILHELAHALAWIHFSERGHGAAWHYFCAVLGIPEEKYATKCEDFTPEHLRRRARYALQNADTGEIYRYYSRLPQINAARLSQSYIPGKKSSTLGKLRIVRILDDED